MFVHAWVCVYNTYSRVGMYVCVLSVTLLTCLSPMISSPSPLPSSLLLFQDNRKGTRSSFFFLRRNKKKKKKKKLFGCVVCCIFLFPFVFFFHGKTTIVLLVQQVCVCVSVFSSYIFWVPVYTTPVRRYDSIKYPKILVDAPAGVTREEGHTQQFFEWEQQQH